jgi:hypothetical protein
VSATLKLVREPIVMEWHRGSFEVLVDGRLAGAVERHQAAETPVEPGRHTVQLRTGRYSSRPHSFEAADNEVVTFRCSSGRIWPIFLASLVKPDLALILRHE